MVYNSQDQRKTHNVYERTAHVNKKTPFIWESNLRGKLHIFFLFFSVAHFLVPVVLFDPDYLSSECS